MIQRDTTDSGPLGDEQATLSKGQEIVIPSEADILIAYSTVPGKDIELFLNFIFHVQVSTESLI